MGWEMLGVECWVLMMCGIECWGMGDECWVLMMCGIECWGMGDEYWVLMMCGIECWVMMMCGFTMNFIETINTHHSTPTTQHPAPNIHLSSKYIDKICKENVGKWVKNELFKSLRKFFVIK